MDRIRWTTPPGTGLPDRAAGVLVLVAAMVAASVAGCGERTGPAARTEPASSVTLLAAASLTEAFALIADRFEAAHPGVSVTLSFGASSTLAQQIQQGAPADAFAAASSEVMRQVVEAGLVDGSPTVFARNRLVIAASAGNPKGIAGLADLARPDVSVAVCAAQVPCGAAAVTVLRAAGVSMTPVSEELDVKAALTKVTFGEVDAALVYHSDVISASGRVEGIEFAESAMAINSYPIAVLSDATNPVTAASFVDFVQSDSAQAILHDLGFQPS